MVQDPALSVGLTKARPSTRAIKSAGGSATPAVRAGHGFQPGRGRAADRGVPPFQRPDARSRVGSFPRFAVACLVWCGPGRRSPGGRGILCRHRPKVEWTSHYLLTARAQHGRRVRLTHCRSLARSNNVTLPTTSYIGARRSPGIRRVAPRGRAVLRPKTRALDDGDPGRGAGLRI